jgi:hypothetical protein
MRHDREVVENVDDRRLQSLPEATEALIRVATRCRDG